jgi:hypothetical protein
MVLDAGYEQNDLTHAITDIEIVDSVTSNLPHVTYR